MKWKIVGAHRDTGEDIAIEIDAATQSDAATKAGTIGVLVASVAAIEDATTAVPLAYARPITDRQAEVPSPVLGQVQLPGERELLAAPGVRVTTKRLLIGAETHAIANLTSVSVRRYSTGNPGAKWLFVGSIPFVFVGLVSFQMVSSRELLQAFVLLAVGLGMFGAGIAFVVLKPKEYALCVRSAAGDQNLLISPDTIMLHAVVAAINEAIACR